ncbi:unnamed protein product [Ectocarpus sp. CCAP 1310/34]|nr:unnamed protein product [Ectocarpus sp. CCAP 1310/34]
MHPKDLARGLGLAQTSLCLHHYVDSTDGGVEHEPPNVFDNEMTDEMIEEQASTIRMLHFQKVDTKTIHKALQSGKRRLGERGKPKVRTMRVRFNKEQADELGGANDAQQLLERLQLEGCWMRFELDNAGRITRIAWATDEQRKNVLRYHWIIIQDNTFNTNE